MNEVKELANALEVGKLTNQITETLNQIKNSTMIGQILQHRHNSNIIIEVVSETKRGYKVKQTDLGAKKLKIKTAYFDKVDIKGEKSLFKTRA